MITQSQGRVWVKFSRSNPHRNETRLGPCTYFLGSTIDEISKLIHFRPHSLTRFLHLWCTIYHLYDSLSSAIRMWMFVPDLSAAKCYFFKSDLFRHSLQVLWLTITLPKAESGDQSLWRFDWMIWKMSLSLNLKCPTRPKHRLQGVK